MRIMHPIFSVGILVVALACGSCRFDEKEQEPSAKDNHLRGAINQHSNLPFDSNILSSFYNTYPGLSRYRKDVATIYTQRRFTHIWYDEKGMVEFGHTLYSKVKAIGAEGVPTKFPYMDKVDGVFADERENTLTRTETELMLTNLYLFYAQNVYAGIAESSTKAIEWLLPRKQVAYATLLDSMMADPRKLNRDDTVLFSQYYKLRDVLRRYREIEKKGGWKPIDPAPGLKGYKPGDTSQPILQIRERLFATGDIKQNNNSNRYDDELEDAVIRYQLRNGFKPDKSISPRLIRDMNVPAGERIKKIIVNMERCRWISPEFANAKEYIVVNIPSYTVTMVRNGKKGFESPVVVGKSATKTVTFSGMMSHIVFSPYWNPPQSIVAEEIKPKLKKNKNYLKTHNMEWNNGRIRQKPGRNNSLGLVKFIFPNSNDIYMHDTPSKSLFEKESRAFSHGCIRVGKPRDFAIEILKDDPNWTSAKIDAAMHAGKERSYSLKKKIPVYIGYLTAWVDPEGRINFYEDIYDRDDRLAELLIGEK
jgi:L,D-transpeptidase YcbB